MFINEMFCYCQILKHIAEAAAKQHVKVKFGESETSGLGLVFHRDSEANSWRTLIFHRGSEATSRRGLIFHRGSEANPWRRRRSKDRFDYLPVDKLLPSRDHLCWRWRLLRWRLLFSLRRLSARVPTRRYARSASLNSSPRSCFSM